MERINSQMTLTLLLLCLVCIAAACAFGTIYLDLGVATDEWNKNIKRRCLQLTVLFLVIAAWLVSKAWR